MPSHKKILSFLIVALIAAAQFAAFAPRAQACSCALMELPGDKMAEYAMQTYDAIFAGEVTNIIDDSIQDYQANFKTLQWWKGGQSAQVTLTTFGLAGGCEYYFQQGERYLIYAHKDIGRNNQVAFTANICSPTKKLADADEEIKYLNALRGDIVPTPPDEPSMPPGGTINVITKEGEEQGVGAPIVEYPIKHMRGAARFVSNLLLFGLGILFLSITVIYGITLAVRASQKTNTP